MTKRPFRIGMIGYQFMGRAHSNSYRQVGRFFDLELEPEMRTICGRNEVAVREAAHRLGWQHAETDWRRVIDDPEIDAIDIVTPGDSHAEIAIAAAQAGKAVFCEKPLANTLAEAEAMLNAVLDAKVPHALFHNYRKAPAVALAKKWIDEGRLGQIYHFRAVYLQDWIANPDFPLVWRLRKEIAGSGAHGDIHSHILDLGRHLVGEISEVSGALTTFIKERPLVDDPTRKGEVTVDDAAMCLARFENGAMGTFEASRFATGRKNFNRFEINGSLGSVAFNLERMNELEYFDARDTADAIGFRTINVTEGCHPYSGHYWPSGHIIGYEHTFTNLVADALAAIAQGTLPSPNFVDGCANQRVLDAIESSNQQKRWVSI